MSRERGRRRPPLHQLVPRSTSTPDHLDAVYRDLQLPTGSGERPYVILNMVSTVDGKVALNGSAGGIGSRTDRWLMRRIRSHVDAVMIAAGTLRAEICDPRVDTLFVQERLTRGLSAQPLAVGVSESLNLDPTNRFLVNGRDSTILLTGSGASADRRRQLAPYATFLETPGPRVDLRASLRKLYTQFGVRWLLCEGGPSLNQQLLDAGLIDEVFWTLAPKLAGGAGPTLVQDTAPTVRITSQLDLLSLYEVESELFARYRLRRAADGSYLV